MAALGIGAVIVLVENIAADIAIGRTLFADGALGFIDAPHVALLHLCMASAPMLVLALAGSRRRAPWLTAILLSALWGWWHLAILPTTGWIQFAGLVIALPLMHLVPGVTFSYGWRMSGSLLAPAVVHSFIDSFRNSVM